MPNLVKYGIIILIGSILFFPFLGNVPLFDWDEANFAEAAREMLVNKSYMRVYIDFQPFWEKPPIFIWMQALSMKLWGVNEFAARFPNAIIGIITLCSLFYIGKKVSSERVAIWWVLLYVASWLPHFYFKTAIIDPTFNLFIFWAVFHLHQVRFLETIGSKHAWLSGIFLGLAVLTKGPAAILICLLAFAAYFFVQKGKIGITWKQILYVTIACFVTTAIWFGIDIVQNGWWFTTEFITYQIRLLTTEDAGHGGPFIYHFIVLLIGCFPAAAFLFQSGSKSAMHSINRKEKDFVYWMWCLFWVVLILFSLVKTKIVHYSSLCYLPLTYLAALQVARIEIGSIQIKKTVKWILGFTGVLIAIALIILPIIGNNLQVIIPYVKDAFAVENMKAEVEWPYWYVLFGLLSLGCIIYSLILLNKKFSTAIYTLISSQVIVIFISMSLVVPKIEKYSQGAAIDFYKSLDGKDVYLQPLGFKSYAYLFYSKALESVPAEHYPNKVGWLLEGAINKPAYFICKIHQLPMYIDHPNLKVIGSKNGYVFLERINGVGSH